jgi:hypothetical protein
MGNFKETFAVVESGLRVGFFLVGVLTPVLVLLRWFDR